MNTEKPLSAQGRAALGRDTLASIAASAFCARNAIADGDPDEADDYLADIIERCGQSHLNSTATLRQNEDAA